MDERHVMPNFDRAIVENVPPEFSRYRPGITQEAIDAAEAAASWTIAWPAMTKAEWRRRKRHARAWADRMARLVVEV